MKRKIFLLCLLLLSVLVAAMCADGKTYFGFREKARELVADWNALPLPENQNLMFYDSDTDRLYYFELDT